MSDSFPLHRAVHDLACWAYMDSKVLLDQAKLRELLEEDAKTAGYYPDHNQCRDFICGDDDGTPPAKLVTDFPRTHQYLEEIWS